MRRIRGKAVAIFLGVVAVTSCVVALAPTMLEFWYISKLDDDNDDVRHRAIRRLGEMRSTFAAPSIAELLRESSPDYDMARRALLEIGPAAIPSIVDEIRNAARALRELNTSPEIDPARVGRAGAFVTRGILFLAEFGPAAIPGLGELLVHDRHLLAATAIRDTGSAGRAFLLGVLRQHQDPAVREVAASGLSDRRQTIRASDAIVDALSAALRDGSPGVRNAARRALSSLGVTVEQ